VSKLIRQIEVDVSTTHDPQEYRCVYVDVYEADREEARRQVVESYGEDSLDITDAEIDEVADHIAMDRWERSREC